MQWSGHSRDGRRKGRAEQGQGTLRLDEPRDVQEAEKNVPRRPPLETWTTGPSPAADARYS